MLLRCFPYVRLHGYFRGLSIARIHLKESSKSGSARPKSRHRERAHTGAPQEEAGREVSPLFFPFGEQGRKLASSPRRSPQKGARRSVGGPGFEVVLKRPLRSVQNDRRAHSNALTGFHGMRTIAVIFKTQDIYENCVELFYL